MFFLQWQRSWVVYFLYYRSIYKIYFDIFFYFFVRLDGRAGDSLVLEVIFIDRFLIYSNSGISYVLLVKKFEFLVVLLGKVWEFSKQGALFFFFVCVVLGYVIGSYAAVLKKKGGLQDVSELFSFFCEIDEILCDLGNNNFQLVFFCSLQRVYIKSVFIVLCR